MRKSERAAPHEPYSDATRAKMLARRGETDEALRLSAEAVALARRGDCLMDIGDYLRDRAEVFRLLGRPDEERSALEEALVAYERKGICLRSSAHGRASPNSSWTQCSNEGNDAFALDTPD